MTQGPYSWQLTGSCPACGSPIYGRVRKPGRRVPVKVKEITEEWFESEEPEARRTCPVSCPHGGGKAGASIKAGGLEMNLP